MNRTSTVDRLAMLSALADIPRDQLEWLVEHGEVRHLDDGAELRGGDPDVFGVFVVISGRFSVRMDQGGVVREMREITPGGITGYLPYSRITAPRGYLAADGPVEYLFIRREDVRELTRECYEFTAACVHEMLDRVRVFKGDDEHQEKMAALGRLSAGLAHELNNPTAAVAGAARALDAARSEVAEASRAVGAGGLDGGAAAALEALEAAIRRAANEALSPLERADLEDRAAAWLDAHGIDAELTYPLVGHGVTVDDLDAAASALAPGQLAMALRYVAADATARGLIADITSAADRIHSLVAAVKKHTHMDRAHTLEAIVLEEHLADTVSLMTSKASAKGVALELVAEADLPAVSGSVVDLNQVWMHLVDNAVDAATTIVRISVDDGGPPNMVVVRVVDDGPGIAAENVERVFEPFFTTKDVGQGRGLGLDVVRALVSDHRGTVDLTSVPGRTEFRVTLPVAGS